MNHVDVQVVGAGPAGLALSIELASRGLRVRLVGGEDRPWTPNYGVWTDEFDALGLSDCLAQSWASTDVWSSNGLRTLDRGYARVDKHALRSALLGRAAGVGVQVSWTDAVSVEHDATGSVLHTSEGDERSTLVVDASGHNPVLVERSGQPTHWQAAYGVSARVEGHPWSTERMTFMDLRQPPPCDGLPDVDTTFLYVMPQAGSRLFVEETSLLRAPAMPFATLRRRLRARLGALGLVLEDEADHELCIFPMDPPLPRLDQRVVGFGAAASMVHPATGYSLARSLRSAPELADTVAQQLGAGVDVQRAAAAAWRTLWTDDRLMVRQLQLYGSRIVADMGPAQVNEFFESFFSCPDSLTREYLAGDGNTRSVVTAMVSLFAGCNAGMRWTLARASHRLPGALWRRATA